MRSSSALFQSDYGRQGNFELIVTNNPSGADGTRRGGLFTLQRNNDAGMVWVWRDFHITTVDDYGTGERLQDDPPPVEQAYRFPCWVEGTDHNFHGVCVLGSNVWYFAIQPVTSVALYPPRPGGVPPAIPAGTVLPSNCVGAPAFIQSLFGSPGNFELIVPTSGGGMHHFWHDNSGGLPNLSFFAPHGTIAFSGWLSAHQFGMNPVAGVRLLHSDFGNLEVVALERSRSGNQLVHYWQNGPGGPWISGEVLPESEQVGGLPGFIQSSFRTNPGNGNLEVVAPLSGGGLAWWTSFIDPTGSRVWQRQRDQVLDNDHTRVEVVHLIQSNYNDNFEVIAETGDTPYGYGSLFFYFHDTAMARWNGPFPIRP
jgi:hypothetical protein